MTVDFKQIFRNKWLLVLGILGIACLLFGSFWNQGAQVFKSAAGSSPSPSPSNNSSNPSDLSLTGLDQTNDPTFAYEQFYSRELKSILSSIAGINDVSVMVTLDSTGDQEIANNIRKTQTNSGSGSGSSTSVTTETDVYSQHNADGSSTPFVTQKTTPKVRGVLVTVNANDFYQAKQEIIDAIEHVLDVPAYKISVEPKQDKP
jgi:stage III sporulation protein AG